MATAIIGTLKHLPKASILPTLPETGRPNRVYFIPNEDPTEDNRYNEYLWVKDETYPDGHWELVGPTTIDLTDYASGAYLWLTVIPQVLYQVRIRLS